MNKRDAYNDGKQYGYNVASWVDVPEIGTHVDPSVDFWGIGKTVTKDNILEYVELLCYAAVDNSRQYTEFSFIAYDINECYNADGLWDSFEDGINRGIAIRINEVKKAL